MAERPVIGLAHGSRHAGVVESIAAVMDAVSAATSAPACPAFLDLTEPDLTAVATTLAAAGHGEAVAVPLLFTSAFHATVDVPQAVREATEASGLRLSTARILGTGDDILEVLAAHAGAVGIGDDDPVLLFAVGSSDADANTAVHDLAGRLAARRGTPVRAGFGTTEPRGTAVLDELGGTAAVLPLFVSSGLLLEPMLRRTAASGQTMAPPLGAKVAPLVAARYREAVEAVGSST